MVKLTYWCFPKFDERNCTISGNNFVILMELSIMEEFLLIVMSVPLLWLQNIAIRQHKKFGYLAQYVI